MLQHFSARTAVITETRRQSGRAIQAQALRHVLHMEAQGRVWVSSTSHAIHHLLLTLLTQRSALMQAESLRRRMYCAAARQHLTLSTFAVESPPMTATEQAQISQYAILRGPLRGHRKFYTYCGP